MFIRSLLTVMVISLTARSVRADVVVECDDDRARCTAELESTCPGRAQITNEQTNVTPATPTTPAKTTFRISFRCAPASEGEGALPAAPAAVAPAVEGPAAEAPAAPAPTETAEPVAPAPPSRGRSADSRVRQPVVTGSLRRTYSDDTREELERVEAELEGLTRERAQHSLAAPIVLTAIGFGGALGSLLIGLTLSASADIDESYEGDIENEEAIDDQRRTAKVFYGLSVIGVAMGIGGVVWLGKRRQERNVHAPEIRALKERRRMLRRQVQYGLVVDPASRALGLRARF